MGDSDDSYDFSNLALFIEKLPGLPTDDGQPLSRRDPARRHPAWHDAALHRYCGTRS